MRLLPAKFGKHLAYKTSDLESTIDENGCGAWALQSLALACTFTFSMGKLWNFPEVKIHSYLTKYYKDFFLGYPNRKILMISQ